MPTASEIAALSKKYVHHFNSCTKDSDRMAALILLGRLLAHKQCSIEIRRSALQKMDLSFVARMLKSNSVLNDDSGSSVSLQEAAVAVLQHWAADSELRTSPSFLSLLPALGQIVATARPSPEASTCVTDVYQCLNLHLGAVEGRVALLEAGVVPLLCRAVTESCQGHEKAMDILQYLADCHPGVLWELHPFEMGQLISCLTDQLTDSSKSEEISTFKLIDTICRLIRGLDNECSSSPEWLGRLANDVMGVLRSRLNAEQRRSALLLAAELSRVWAFDWLQSRPVDELSLLIRLAAIEVGVLTEYCASATQAATQADLLVACFSILEAAVRWLSSPSNGDAFAGLVRPLEEAFGALSRWLCRWTSEGASSDLIVCAATRVLAAWLAQDDWQRTEVERLPEDLLKAFHVICSQSEETQADDLVRFLLPALCLTSADWNQRRILMRHGWPGLILNFTERQVNRCEVSSSLCSAISFLLSFLMASEWLDAVPSLVAAVTSRWHALMALADTSLSLHLTLLLAAVMKQRMELLSEQAILRMVETLLAPFEKTNDGFQRSKKVQSDWEDVEGLWLLSMQIITDTLESRPSLRSRISRAGFCEPLEAIVNGLCHADPCYTSLAAMKSVLFIPSPRTA